MVYSFGLMVGSTKGVGRMENNTVKVITHLLQEKYNMENGKKENVLNGFHEINLSKNKIRRMPKEARKFNKSKPNQTLKAKRRTKTPNKKR